MYVCMRHSLSHSHSHSHSQIPPSSLTLSPSSSFFFNPLPVFPSSSTQPTPPSSKWCSATGHPASRPTKTVRSNKAAWSTLGPMLLSYTPLSCSSSSEKEGEEALGSVWRVLLLLLSEVEVTRLGVFLWSWRRQRQGRWKVWVQG